MAGVDVIVCWPVGCDYPRWRQFIRDERERFNEVFVMFTGHDGPDHRNWLRANFPDVTMLDAPTGKDWRNAAVNAALERSRADRVWFTEQDFEITDPDAFWPQTTGPVVGIQTDQRLLHPACIFVERPLIEVTSRYFGPEPLDHFAAFTYELDEVAPMRRIAAGSWRHYQATSESILLRAMGQPPRFRPEQFEAWLADSRLADVPLLPGW